MEYLKKTDPEMGEILEREIKRQNETLTLIPSENHSSFAVREIVGSCLQDKYCEGYPFKRYYQGQENFDRLETLCQERAKKAFGVPFVNAQPLSGAPANTAVYFALLEPGDTIMGLRLDQGGHLTHGLKLNISGKYFNSTFYAVDENEMIDYDGMEKMALEQKPKIIIAGITSYPMALDFERFSRIADKCGAYLLADIAHVSGLVLAGAYPDPAPWCHLITTTTHKTLRGPRGALIMATDKGFAKDPELDKKINRAVFPGLQGGPHENNIAGIAVALKEAQSPGFAEYGSQVVKNAQALAQTLRQNAIRLCCGGTDTHLIVIDLRDLDILGNTAAEALEAIGIVTNKNAIPNDPNPPFYPSGLRIGTPAATSRGMKEEQMRRIGAMIGNVLKKVSESKRMLNVSFEEEKNVETRKKIISNAEMSGREEIQKLCSDFPIRKSY